MWITMQRPRLELAVFLLSLLLVVFGYGILVGRYEFFPYSILKFAQDSVQQVFADKETILRLRPIEFLEPARYAGNGILTWKKDQAVPGLTLLSGFFGDSNELRLIRLDGTIVHRWPLNFSRIFPNTSHILPAKAVPQTNWNVSVQGDMILPDGSVIFNFTGKGTAKLDRCGDTEWTIPRMTHHSIEPARGDTFWIPSARYVEHTPQYPHLRVPYFDETVLHVASDGTVLKEISVLDILHQNHLEGFVLRDGVTDDITHLNDVEELSPSMASRFPMFAAGDLLISMRFKSLVIVVDPETLVVKWYQAGPWIEQHDPDFLESGLIRLFSNNLDGTNTGVVFGGSSVLEVDPATRRVQRDYGGRDDQPMYTMERGATQTLKGSNDHILVTESRAGRVFELNEDREIVWEYLNRYDETSAALVSEAKRYPDDYFSVDDWTCP